MKKYKLILINKNKNIHLQNIFCTFNIIYIIKSIKGIIFKTSCSIIKKNKYAINILHIFFNPKKIIFLKNEIKKKLSNIKFLILKI